MQLWASGVAGRADGRLRSYANQVKCRQCGDLSRLHLLAGVNVVFADKCERGTSHLLHSTEKAVQYIGRRSVPALAWHLSRLQRWPLLIQLPTCPALPSPPSLSYNQCGLILNAAPVTAGDGTNSCSFHYQSELFRAYGLPIASSLCLLPLTKERAPLRPDCPSVGPSVCWPHSLPDGA